MLRLAAWSALKTPSLLYLSTLTHYVAAKYAAQLFNLYWFNWKPTADRKSLAEPQVRENVRRSFLESLRQGMRFAVEEWKLYAAPWGFALSDINKRIHLWHGTEDRNVAYASATYAKSRLKDATLQTYPESGHYLLYEHGHEIFRQLPSQ